LEGVAFADAALGEAVQLPPLLRDRKRRPTANALPPVRVLLVEDGETNRELFSLVLRNAGASVVCAQNGQQGVQQASEQAFDLILMDMQMPVMDGYTATQTLRARGYQGPIVALTAHAMRGDEEKCLAAGCSGYLSKPVQIDRLLEAVRAAMGGASVASTPESNTETAETPEPATQCETESATPLDSPPHEGEIVSTLPIELPQFRRIVDEFILKLADRLTAMESACATGDWDKLAKLAHWLKGSGGTVGLDCLTAPSRELEQHAKRGDATAASMTLSEIRALADRFAVPAHGSLAEQPGRFLE
jgi:CheY-like chemotaxis protein/HPt (histidine-containing phosphotransfer) domain-containing protein